MLLKISNDVAAKVINYFLPSEVHFVPFSAVATTVLNRFLEGLFG